MFYLIYSNKMTLREEREQRGMVYQFSDEALFDLYNKWGQKFYIWFDPSADSLQIWNMFSVMAAIHLMKYWNKCYFLVWWATGRIWDPSGKNAERSYLSPEQLEHNQNKIYWQLKTFLENINQNYDIKFDYEMVNNYDFIKDMSYLDFLKEVGKYITVNYMISKESIRKRIEDPELSITYAEMSYMLIQWFDFLSLYEKYWVRLQLGWSDQWWNVTTWMDLISKKLWDEAEKAYCLTIPIITDANGKKYGKSEWNAVWVDRAKNSPYYVYQFFLNSDDSLIEKLLKVFSLKSLDEIDAIVKKHNEAPELRYGQKELATWVTEVLFGKQAVKEVEKITEILFANENKMELISKLDKNEIEALREATNWMKMEWDEFRILDLCTQSGLTESNWEAKKMIQSGAIYCNEEKITDIQKIISKADAVNWVLLLRKGKKVNKAIVLD